MAPKQTVIKGLYPTLVAEWSKTLVQIQVEISPLWTQVQSPVGACKYQINTGWCPIKVSSTTNETYSAPFFLLRLDLLYVKKFESNLMI